MIRLFILVALVFSSCAPKGEPLTDALSSEQNLRKDSELTIVFSGEEDPGVRRFSVKASGEKIDAASHTSRGHAHKVTLEAADFGEIISKLRDLSETEFQATGDSDCREPFELKLRVGRWERVFMGCRGVGANASTVSRMARQLEYLLFKRTSS